MVVIVCLKYIFDWSRVDRLTLIRFLRLITVFIFERHLIDVSCEVTAAGYWGTLDWFALMEQRQAMKLSHWVSLTTCLAAPGPFCSLLRVRVTDLCWVLNLGLLSRRSVVTLCVMIEGQRCHLLGKIRFLCKLLPSPLLHVDTFANPGDKRNAAACDFSFYHSNSSHWCCRLWLTGKLERVAIAISPHQLHLWLWTIVSLFRFSHSPFFFCTSPSLLSQKTQTIAFLSRQRAINLLNPSQTWAALCSGIWERTVETTLKKSERGEHNGLVLFVKEKPKLSECAQY